MHTFVHRKDVPVRYYSRYCKGLQGVGGTFFRDKPQKCEIPRPDDGGGIRARGIRDESRRRLDNGKAKRYNLRKNGTWGRIDVNRLVKLLIALVISVVILVARPEFLSDVMEAVPLVGDIAGVIVKFIQTGEFVVPDNMMVWTANEVLNSFLIAVMSSFFGHCFGQMFFNYSRGGFRLGLEYFLCDFIAIVGSCYAAGEFSEAFMMLLGIPAWGAQIILILVFTFVDLVIFASGNGRGFNLLSVRVFLSEIVGSLFKMMFIALVVLVFYRLFMIA